jgi:hypothetical protein
MERKNKNAMENSMLQYYIHMYLSYAPLPGIYLRGNIQVTNGTELSPTISKPYAAYFNELVEKESK